jgi:hypothetical protein
MKNLLPLALIVTVLGGLTAPAFADSWDQEKTAAKNERRADNQAFKANRDAAFGNYRGAQRHAADAADDQFKVHKDLHRARRDARWGW